MIFLGGCNHKIVSPEGDISSPNWPEDYPSRQDCAWHFIVTEGHRVKLVCNISKHLYRK